MSIHNDTSFNDSKPQADGDAVGRNIIAGQLIKLRTERGLTQKEVVAMLCDRGVNITTCTLSKIENGRRGVSDVEILHFARVFGVSVDTLFE